METKSDRIYLTVKSNEDDRTYIVKVNQMLGKLMDMFRKGVDMQFFHNGRLLKRDESPKMANLKDKDVINAVYLKSEVIDEPALNDQFVSGPPPKKMCCLPKSDEHRPSKVSSAPSQPSTSRATANDSGVAKSGTDQRAIAAKMSKLWPKIDSFFLKVDAIGTFEKMDAGHEMSDDIRPNEAMN